jgi:hypothetical protein
MHHDVKALMVISRRNLFVAGGALTASALATKRSATLAQDASTANNQKEEKLAHTALQSPKGWTRGVMSRGDVRLEVFQKGSGIAVLMHPSLGRPAQDFEDLGNRVAAAGYHAVLINPRGIGGSTGPSLARATRSNACGNS